MVVCKEDKLPIFIHSLFRSGSTWLFNCFRHADYWCYQEPFHEVISDLKEHPDALLRFDNRTSEELRHPELDKPYYYEVHAIREHVAGLFAKCISYDSFFDVTGCNEFTEYTARLISRAHKRPVLQCCRSFGRVRYLKETFGGMHIYLWRNPWDQWWSCQVNDYFDMALVAIVNASNPPRIIAELRRDLGLEIRKCARISDEFDLIRNVPLNATERYLIFYTLWLYSVIENMSLVDINISIDMLSANADYRKMIEGHLDRSGVAGLDFSSCDVPRAVYSEKDKAFFEAAEKRAHQMFLASGYSIESLYEAIKVQEASINLIGSSGDLLGDSYRARDIAIRYANRHSEIVAQYRRQETEITELQRRLDGVLAEINRINAEAEQEKRGCEQERFVMKERESELVERLNEAEAYRRLMEDKAREAAARAEGSVAEIQHWRSVAHRLNEDLQAILGSRSWRLTMPLRNSKDLVVRLGRFSARLPHQVVGVGKRAARAFLIRLLRFVLARPALKARLDPWARRYPSLEARIRRMAVERGLVVGSRVAAHSASVAGPGELAEPARLIHARLHVLVKSKERGE